MNIAHVRALRVAEMGFIIVLLRRLDFLMVGRCPRDVTRPSSAKPLVVDNEGRAYVKA
jgi:hypothetical protein